MIEKGTVQEIDEQREKKEKQIYMASNAKFSLRAYIWHKEVILGGGILWYLDTVLFLSRI